MFRFLFLLFGIAAVVAGLAYKDYNDFLETPLSISESQSHFTIERGWSAKREIIGNQNGRICINRLANRARAV